MTVISKSKGSNNRVLDTVRIQQSYKLPEFRMNFHLGLSMTVIFRIRDGVSLYPMMA